MSNKLIDNKRRNHVEKALKNSSKKSTATDLAKSITPSKKEHTLQDQYNIIRKDILKLRDDLVKGYDMAKSEVEKKGFMKQILSVK